MVRFADVFAGWKILSALRRQLNWNLYIADKILARLGVVTQKVQQLPRLFGELNWIMKKEIPIPENYLGVLDVIKKRIRADQYETLKAVSRELIILYWGIGGFIVNRQKGND